MATATQISVQSDASAELRVPEIAPEAAAKTTALLQANHVDHDMIFNDYGLHNHIAHHIYTAFALGADSDLLQSLYDRNAISQRPPRKLDESVVADLHDRPNFISHMGKTENCRNFMAFFEDAISKHGYQTVINEYLFKGDELANLMFNRAFSSYYHPLIHLGFGLEFTQPVTVAEALSEMTFHPTYYDPFFNEADEKARKRGPQSEHMIDLICELGADETLKNSIKWDDPNKIRDGLLPRGKDRFADYASRWTVQADDLAERLAEVTNISAFVAGAAQNPKKIVKFDFYLMHAVNSTIFFSQFLKQDWISTANKAKLMEWRGREDMLLYVSRGTPKLSIEEIINYKPLRSSQTWAMLFKRGSEMMDDGHSAKLIRAFAHGRKVCAPYEHLGHFLIKGDMWLQLANMAIDSVEGAETRWIRDPGFEEAWEKFADRSEQE